jgi:phage gpG-like protein
VISVRVNGSEALSANLQQIKQNAASLQTPLLNSAILVRDEAVLNIKAQGRPTWIPNQRGGHTGIDTGRLWQSIGISAATGTSIRVGTNVKYAGYFQYGTGIYAGHSAWTIRAVNGRALAFTIGGSKFFRRSVTIKGQPARPFLFIDDPLRARITQTFAAWLMGAAA